MTVKKFPPLEQTIPTKEIVSQINRLGLKDAAQFYGVSERTLFRWLSKHGYKLKRIYVKEAAGKPE